MKITHTPPTTVKRSFLRNAVQNAASFFVNFGIKKSADEYVRHRGGQSCNGGAELLLFATRYGFGRDLPSGVERAEHLRYAEHSADEPERRRKLTDQFNKKGSGASKSSITRRQESHKSLLCRALRRADKRRRAEFYVDTTRLFFTVFSLGY